MEKVAVLIDFTDICGKALEFASKIAESSKATLTLIHVSDFGEDEKAVEAENKLQEMHTSVSANVEIINHVARGSFFSVIPSVVTDLAIDLVVVPTHGKVGLIQNLLGANILKLVKTLSVPALVVQASSKFDDSGLEKLLFPVGPHSNFDVKYKQTAMFAKAFSSSVVIYTVQKDIRGMSDEIRKNIADSKTHFQENNVAFEVVNEEPTGFSAGYAKHIIQHAKEHNIGAICIMSLVSDDNGYIGNTDKENILLNDYAIPVLCCNS